MPAPELDRDNWRYNCQDCLRTREIGEVSAQMIAKAGLAEPEAFQQKLLWPVLQAMQRGVRIDIGRRKAMRDELATEMQRRKEFFARVLGHDLNVNSHVQMKALFYGDLKQPTVMSRATKGKPAAPTCNDEALIKIARHEPLLKPLIQAIQEYRTIRVLLSTFVEAPLDVDGRMRCSYNIAGTHTYRFSSRENAFGSGGNLQNIPKGGVEDEFDLVVPNIRTMFVPDPGFIFFDTDLSKADLRIVTWEADEPEMKALLRAGKDPYVEVAREYHKDPSISKMLPDGSENPKYTKFKSLCHGTHYLGSASGLAGRLGMTTHEVARVQRWYFGRFPRIHQWQQRFVEEVTRTRRTRNVFGYVQRWDGRVGDAMMREAIAWVPQSTVACLINRIWVKVYETVPEVQVLLQTHDSISGQFPAHRAEHCLAAMAKCAEVVLPYNDPLIIPVGVKTSADSWGACG